MGKLLLILLLFISLTGSAQMKITPHIKEKAFGYEFTYNLYQAKDTTCKFYLIFLHGLGEIGPIDGTQLPEVEKYAWPKAARDGHDFPFNIIAIQTSTDHRNNMKVFPTFVKFKYDADVIIVTGLSLGGFGSYDAKMYDVFDFVYAIAPVCGAGRMASIKDYPPTMRVFHFHGDADKRVRWSTARGFIETYNSTREGPDIEYVVYPGVGHDSWSQAYSLTPGKDQLYQWVLKMFAQGRSINVTDDRAAKIDSIRWIVINALDELR